MHRPLLSLALVTLLAGCGGTVVFEEDGGEGGAPQASTVAVGSVASGSVGPSASSSTSSGGVTVGSAATGSSTSGSGTSSGGGATASASGSVSTGAGPCQTHDDCFDGVCIQGTCSRRCEAGQCDACTPGTVCNACATSSCPDCDDCIAACVPTTEGFCDDDDPCPGADQVCLFPYGYCAPSCESGECADPNMVCSECATGSCCGCENCVSACFPLDG